MARVDRGAAHRFIMHGLGKHTKFPDVKDGQVDNNAEYNNENYNVEYNGQQEEQGNYYNAADQYDNVESIPKKKKKRSKKNNAVLDENMEGPQIETVDICNEKPKKKKKNKRVSEAVDSSVIDQSLVNEESPEAVETPNADIDASKPKKKKKKKNNVSSAVDEDSVAVEDVEDQSVIDTDKPKKNKKRKH